MLFDRNRRWLGPAALLTAVALASGCAQRGGPISYNVPNFGVPDPSRPVVPSADYTLVPGDKLMLTVYQVKELTGEHVVDLSGKIAVPLIGDVQAMGFTADQLAAEIAQRLGEKYLRNPAVTVGVMESVGRLVTVEGSVEQPGLYPVMSEMTLLSAVASARGTDENANPHRVAIFRRIDGQRMAAAFDLVSIRRGEMVDPEVYAGDIVVVEGSKTPGVIRNILSALGTLALFRPY